MSLPTGAVTFLFTDIEGSTRLLQDLGDTRYAQVLADHHSLLRSAFEMRGGHEIETQGDGFLVAFQSVRDAVLAAIDAQRAVATHLWPAGAIVRVRMGLHTGEPLIIDGGYAGLDVHRAARICEAGWGGQILTSKTTSTFLERDPPQHISLRDLGEHRLKSLLRPERIYHILDVQIPESFPPLRSLTSLPNNLPGQLTSFVGREREVSEVKGLLARTRLLTLGGPGGCGKTRLALQVAADLVDEYRDGVWFVELASVVDPAIVATAVVSALGVRAEPAPQLLAGHEQSGRHPMAMLLDYLQRKQILLVLDNCEHLVSACAQLAEMLLRACPDLRILATSQEALGIAGEAQWVVPPLSLPDPASLPALHDLTLYPAIQLFLDRATAVAPNFRLTSENARAVAQVVHRLDGIPLAIELAAARVRVLSVEQIASRLADRFRLLTGGSRTGVQRQQTLRAVMDWSYGLLAERERILLRRLSVFVGGFPLEAAEAICEGEGIGAATVLDLVARLVDKSLVIVDDRRDAVRYRLLETVRQYGQGRLLESGEEARIRDQHRDWYLRLAERGEPELHGPDQVAWLERLETEHDNFRAAMRLSLDSGQTERGLRLASALWWFWYVHGFLEEGRRWAEQAIAGGADVPASLRARVMQRAGLLSWAQGDYARAVDLCEQSVALGREAGDPLAVAYALITLGMVAHRQREYARAAALYEEALPMARLEGDKWITSVVMLFLGRVVLHWEDYDRADRLFRDGLALSRELGDRWSTAYYLYQQGLAARRQGNYERAWALFQESLTRFQEIGSKEGMKFSLNMLGRGAHTQGDHSRAAESYGESLRLSREIGDKPGTSYALSHLAQTVHRQGDRERAAALYRESLILRAELLDRRGIGECLAGLAAIAWGTGHSVRAARLLGASDSLRGAAGLPPDEDRADEDPDVAIARAGLVEPTLADAWAEGQAMPLDQVIGYALSGGV